VIARSDAVAALRAERFDVVVVGGGITGAGVALDAATRGYSVALVEKADYASGTSSRSSKLVHGGLRYLQNFDLGLVREALLERQLMVRLAPHLVRPLPFVVPAFDGARPDRMMGVGLNLYDAMARGGRRREEGDWEPERHRVIGGDEVVERLPALAGRAPTARPTTAASCSRCWPRPSASARCARTAWRSPTCSTTAGARAASACATR
jgi:glycerol-3-phosphate dehydrogenase